VRNARHAAWMVGLVSLAVFVNYIDRGNLATAAAPMQDDLHLSPTELGILLSAFYYGYVPCQPAVGWLAERYGAHLILAGGVFLWSVATIATGFAGGFVSLLGLRILLGIGESVAFPCASKVLARYVDVGHLGIANGILSFGYLLGPAIGTYVGGNLMVVFGWRPVFMLLGGLSLLWLWPWNRVAGAGDPEPDASTAAPVVVTDTQPTFREILRQRALWGASLGHFASNYCYYFIVSWLPYYLVKARGFSMGSMAETAAWAYLLNALSALAMGWLADRWIRSGRSPTLVYKSVMGLTHLVGTGCMAGMVLLPETGSLVSLFVFELVSGASYPGLFAIPQIIGGPSAAGRWVGVQNAVGNVAGLIAPTITGILVGTTGHFDIAFALAAGVNVLGFVGWVFVMPGVRPLDWAAERLRHSAAAPSIA